MLERPLSLYWTSAWSVMIISTIFRNNCTTEAIKRNLFNCDFVHCIHRSEVPAATYRKDLYAIAESIHPGKYWKLGEQLGYPEAKLKQWEKDNEESILKATYSMLCDRLKNMSDTEWMNTLMTACDQCGLKKISLHLKQGVLFRFMIRRIKQAHDVIKTLKNIWSLIKKL